MEIVFQGDTDVMGGPPPEGSTNDGHGGHDIAIVDMGIRKFLMGMPMSMAVFNRDGIHLAKNEISVLGTKPSDVMGKNVREMVPADQHYIMEALLTAVIDYHRKISDMHFDMIHKDGSIVTVNLSCMPVGWDGATYLLGFANRSHKLSTVESFAEGSLQSLYDIQKQLKAINDSVGVLRTLLINGPERL